MTILDRTFVTRAAPRQVRPTTSIAGAAVGLFETSSDVNACILQVHRLVECLDAHLEATLRARYPKATFLSAKILPDCVIGGETNASGLAATGAGALEGTSGTVNLCDMGPTFDRDNHGYNQWKIFRRSFQSFEKDWDAELLSVMSADSYRKCQDFAKQANDWTVRMGSLGVGVATCPKIPSSTTDNALDTLLSIVKWGVAGILLVGVVSVLRG
jgi:hypothetical protein